LLARRLREKKKKTENDTKREKKRPVICARCEKKKRKMKKEGHLRQRGRERKGWLMREREETRRKEKSECRVFLGGGKGKNLAGGGGEKEPTEGRENLSHGSPAETKGE